MYEFNQGRSRLSFCILWRCNWQDREKLSGLQCFDFSKDSEKFLLSDYKLKKNLEYQKGVRNGIKKPSFYAEVLCNLLCLWMRYHKDYLC